MPANGRLRRLAHVTYALRYWLACESPNIPALDAVSRHVFSRELQRFNDILSGTPLTERYWMWGGLLLGWAREGRPLSHDTMDADFAVLSEDASLVEEAVPALEQGGYRRLFRYQNNRDQVTQYTFIRHGAKFEFFLFFPAADPGIRRYFEYSSERVELESQLVKQPLEHFDFLGRRWLKPRDHEQELTAIYGDWMTPDPQWSYANDRCIVARRAWNRRDQTWS